MGGLVCLNMPVFVRKDSTLSIMMYIFSAVMDTEKVNSQDDKNKYLHK